jgi:hypothetical protein
VKFFQIIELEEEKSCVIPEFQALLTQSTYSAHEIFYAGLLPSAWSQNVATLARVHGVNMQLVSLI